MKLPRNTEALLHALAAEMESGFFSLGPQDHCIEIPAADARKLLTKYELWRKQRAKLNTQNPAK